MLLHITTLDMYSTQKVGTRIARLSRPLPFAPIETSSLPLVPIIIHQPFWLPLDPYRHHSLIIVGCSVVSIHLFPEQQPS